MKIRCSEVPKQTFPPYFYQLSERHQPLRLTDGCIYGIGSYCDIGLSNVLRMAAFLSKVDPKVEYAA